MIRHNFAYFAENSHRTEFSPTFNNAISFIKTLCVVFFIYFFMQITIIDLNINNHWFLHYLQILIQNYAWKQRLNL